MIGYVWWKARTFLKRGQVRPKDSHIILVGPPNKTTEVLLFKKEWRCNNKYCALYNSKRECSHVKAVKMYMEAYENV